MSDIHEGIEGAECQVDHIIVFGCDEAHDECLHAVLIRLAEVPWIRGPRETKEQKGREGKGPLAECDKPLRDHTNQMIKSRIWTYL